MSAFKLPNIPSLRAQQLHLQFASLQAEPPPGVYVTVSPSDPTFWSGVLFVQKGPYASAILRFQIRFPATFPDLPPLVTFGTDIFHPLLVPLTTYTFTTGSSDTDTVSATDEERLSPGGFSLRHGFPHWFGRAKRSATASAASSRNASGNKVEEASVVGKDISSNAVASAGSKVQVEPDTTTGQEPSLPIPAVRAADTRTSPVPKGEIYGSGATDVPAVRLLQYIKSTFDDEEVLDSIPLEAAGHPGAWHAWRSHRRSVKGSSNASQNVEESRSGALGSNQTQKKGNPQSRPPGEWNWAGVWENRVQTGIQNSYLESVLFGSSPRTTVDDLVRFQKLDNGLITKIKEELIGSTNIN